MKKTINLIALTLCFVTSFATAEWKIVSEHWYGVTIDGVKSGHVHQIYEQKDFELRSTNVQEMTLSRAGIELQIKVNTIFTETVDGKPVSVVTTQEAMGQVSKTTWLFKGGKIMMISEAGGEPVQKIVDAPEKIWLTPNAVNRFFVEQMREDKPIISYVTMSPELGLNPVTVVLTKLGAETIEVMGHNTEVVKYESTNNVLPVASNEWYTREGLNVGSEMNAGFGAIRNTLMSKHDALASVNEVPELMISMFVEPNMRIPEDEDLDRLVMKVKSKDGSKVELPNSGHQFVTTNDDGTATVIVDLNKAVPATSGELDSPSFMAATAICDASDEAVIAIARETLAALPENASDLDKAKALRAKVFDFIDNKGLSTAFASASQTARDKKGDCSEHGVLLCGVLRAAGIPSRGVMGLVYVPLLKENGVFGWHMWSQALIDGHWIDLDATLETVHSVGHVTTLTTPLSDENLSADMAGLMGTLGNLEVEILEIGNLSKE